MNADGGMANTEMVSGTGDSAEGRRHQIGVVMRS